MGWLYISQYNVTNQSHVQYDLCLHVRSKITRVYPIVQLSTWQSYHNLEGVQEIGMQ